MNNFLDYLKTQLNKQEQICFILGIIVMITVLFLVVINIPWMLIVIILIPLFLAIAALFVYPIMIIGEYFGKW